MILMKLVSLASVLLFCPLLVLADTFTLEVSGDADTAPIYVLEGSGVSQFTVDGDLEVEQALTYSMDSVASGAVATTGRLHIKRQAISYPYEWRGWQYWIYRPAWDATFDADSTYRVSNYGQLIVVNFNHRLNSPPNQRSLIDDVECSSARISSAGRMVLVNNGNDDFEFVGLMKGGVQGFDGTGRRIRNFPYSVGFTQTITGFTAADWGAWQAVYQVERSGKRIAGSGKLTVGPEDDPVDSVPQTLRGSYNTRRGIFSWGAAGSGAEKRVSVKIVHDDQDNLVSGKNQITAAGQKRRF
jgi:hypothetical protein